MEQFVNREDELHRLRALYESDQAALAVVYGRRQIGKSSLVLESLKDREGAVYYQAVQETPPVQLTRFIEAAKSVYPGITDIRQAWEPLLRYLIDQDAVVAIDEFPYLIDQDASLPSIIQRLWDHEVDESGATLVLTGSAIGMIHEHVLDGGAPLYGRVSQTPNGRIELQELPFRSLREFVPGYSNEELVFVAGVFGGTPRYLTPLDSSLTLGENIERLLLDADGPLHDEPETVLQMELTEVNRFFALLESMASGNRTRNEIAQGAGIDSRDTSYYFDRLETLGLIERYHPVTADPTRTKTTRYRVRDPLFRFYFKYLYGRAGQYELYGDGAYADLIEPELPAFVSNTFERLCHEAVPTLYTDLQLLRVPGQWWHKDREVDVVAPTSGATLLVGEAKFTNSPLGYGVLAGLEDDAPHIDWTPSDGGDPEYEYALFSRSGFKPSIEEAAASRDDLQLFTLDDVVEALSQAA
ncbi:ATP-binding protein [Salinirubellus salinus]|uniref:ATP-binding protein n=1 Tax=Salinirubellus salinus TaxID=1364945 RepID=A0A9E7UD12_9EURY|nr:ATP-binding protein [Salinirubellus salinus]UWM56823.1 ATP-binding protein [Salinirubellus salinus]